MAGWAGAFRLGIAITAVSARVTSRHSLARLRGQKLSCHGGTHTRHLIATDRKKGVLSGNDSISPISRENENLITA